MKTPLTFLLALLSLPGLLPAAEKPNVLVIYTDDQGSVDAGCYGSPDLVTPAIDRLAETGVRFTQMLAPSAICSASRAGLLTGRYPARAGVPANVSSQEGNSGMPQSEVTMADLVRDNGYRTGHIGKWHLGYTPDTMPLGQGFDYTWGHMGGCIDNYSHFFYWNGPNRHDLWRNGERIWEDGQFFGDRMVEEVNDFVDQESDQPFFIYWAINWPHYPLQGTDKWRKHYADLESPRNKYAAFMSSMDDLIAGVLDHLEAKGLRENTIILFQSDHGHSVEERTFFGGGDSGPYRGHKGTLWEGGIRVPSIISWPGSLPQGEVRDQMVVGTDWFPTLAELAGADLPEGHQIDGSSIVDVIRDVEADTPHERHYWRLGGNPKNAQWVVREGNWKLYGNPRGAAEGEKLFLANLKEDISEESNLAEAHPEVVSRLKAYADEVEVDITATLEARKSP